MKLNYTNIDIIHKYIIFINSLLIKYTIESFKLKEISLSIKNNNNYNIDEYLSNIILNRMGNTTYSVNFNNNLLFLIYIKEENIWEITNNYLISLYMEFNDITNKTSKKIFTEIKYSISRDSGNRFYGKILYIFVDKDGSIYEYNIFNFNNLKIFKNNKWVSATDFQIEAYINFIENNKKIIKYSSKYIQEKDSVKLYSYGIDEKTTFSIKYGEYNNILYVDDNNKSFMICDNDRVRDFNLIVNNFHNSTETYTSIGDIKDEKTELIIDQDWFEKFFKFKEELNPEQNINLPEYKYKDIGDKIIEIYQDEKKESINGLNCGIFEIFSCQDLHQLLDIPVNKKNKNKVSIKNLCIDIVKIHDNPKYANSTIQVETQLNCLEMKTNTYSPESGISDYINNKNSVGPACCICTPAGLAYRNYLYNEFDDPNQIGQDKYYQINMSINLSNYLKKNNIFEDFGTFTNGYLEFFENPQDEYVLKKFDDDLSNTNYFNYIKKTIQCGSHSLQGVFINGQKKEHLINHVYCSGLPKIPDTVKYDNFSKLWLQGIYENTLLIAIMNNLLLKKNKPCFLTTISSGILGIKGEHIKDAINKACETIYNLGFNLEIFLVHNKELNKENIYSEFDKIKIWGK